MNIDVQRNTDVGDFKAWDLPAWDFDRFHEDELPLRLESSISANVIRSISGAAPIAIKLDDGRAYSYVPSSGVITIQKGVVTNAGCVLEFDLLNWQNYVHEFRTPAGLVLAESVSILKGDMAAWGVWAPALRLMYSGRPIYDPDEPLLDINGELLDLNRKFTLADDHAEMAHFLRTAGFLVIRGAMEHRRDELSHEIDRVRDNEREGGLYSWWVENLTTGENVPYRLLFISEQSELVRSLMEEDPVVRQLVSMAQRDLVPLHDRGQGAMSVLKTFKAGEEIAPSIAGNLTWHTDCGLGGCPIMCPSINIGIHLDRSGPESSQLWMLAGTNGRSTNDISVRRAKKLGRAIALDTEPGDVSIHYSCTLHAGPPPTGDSMRRTLYLPFYDPKTLRLLGRFQSFEQILPGYGTGDIPYLDDVAKSLTAEN